MTKITPCKKCGHKLLTLSSFVSQWDADQEPYIANVLEDHEGIYEDVYFTAVYCEKCQEFDGIYIAEPALQDQTAKIADLGAELKERKDLIEQLKLTAIGWQNEEDCCTCSHTEMCGNELVEMLAGEADNG